MKKTILLILLLNISLVSATIELEYKCHSRNCLEGTTIDYSFIIYNNINKKVDVKDFFLKEKDSGRIIEYFEISERIYPKENKVFNFTSNIKAPSSGYTFYFYPCFTTVISNQTHITEAGIVCDEVVRTLSVIPLSKIECRKDSECLATESCNKDMLKCKPLKCKGFEFVINHKCINFGLYALFILVIICLVFVFVLFKQKKHRTHS